MKNVNHGHVEINSITNKKRPLPCPHCFVQRRCLAEVDGSGILGMSWQRCEILK